MLADPFIDTIPKIPVISTRFAWHRSLCWIERFRCTNVQLCINLYICITDRGNVSKGDAIKRKVVGSDCVTCRRHDDELADAQLDQKSALTLDTCACKIPNARNCSLIEAPSTRSGYGKSNPRRDLQALNRSFKSFRIGSMRRLSWPCREVPQLSASFH
jgi:hypothetical protein